MSKEKLKTLFSECDKARIMVKIDDNNCTSSIDIEDVKIKSPYIGCIYSYLTDINLIMEELEEEGSCLIKFGFKSKNKSKTEIIGKIIIDILRKYNYEVGIKFNNLTIVIVESDISIDFKEKWKNRKKLTEEDNEISESEDIVPNNSEIEDNNNSEISESEEYNNNEISESEEDSVIELSEDKIESDEISESEDCPEDCNCYNCVEEQKDN